MLKVMNKFVAIFKLENTYLALFVYMKLTAYLKFRVFRRF